MPRNVIFPGSLLPRVQKTLYEFFFVREVVTFTIDRMEYTVKGTTRERKKKTIHVCAFNFIVHSRR